MDTRSYTLTEFDGEEWLTRLNKGRYKILSKEEKALACEGCFEPKSRADDSALQQYLKARNDNLGKKKKRPAKKSRRLPPVIYRNHEIDVPNDLVKTYIDHVRSIKSHTYAKRRNSVLNSSPSGLEVALMKNLDPSPPYRLKWSNRIFATGSWQCLPRDLRSKIFADDCVADFRSMHFEIYRMLIRKHVPEVSKDIDQLLNGNDIWAFYGEIGLSKDLVKVSLQAVLNGMSRKMGILTIKRNSLTEDEEIRLFDEWVATSSNPEIKRILEYLPKQAIQLTNLIATGRDKLLEAVRRGEVNDGFGKIHAAFDSHSFYQVSGKWVGEGYKLGRKTLNALYSSYELRLMTETVVPVIEAYPTTFKVLLHLHDGVYFGAGRDREIVVKKLKAAVNKILSELDIRSELVVKSVADPT